MEWNDYKAKADKMFMEAFQTPSRLLEDHHLYNPFKELLDRRVTWFEVKTGNFDRAHDWLKHKLYLIHKK